MLLASFAMSAAAFAHRTTQPDAEILAYLSQGGTLEELCGADGLAHHLTAGCEACRISANALTPEDAPSVVAPVVFAALAHRAAHAQARRLQHAHVTPPSRAPPLV